MGQVDPPRAAQIGTVAACATACFAGGEFPVVPVEPGIFSIVPHKCLFCCENSEANQALAG
jgi:hypothetical protein